MKFHMVAYGKRSYPHHVYEGALEWKNIKDYPSLSMLKREAQCSPIVLENELVKRNQDDFLNEDGQFEPGVQINFAAQMTLNGNYRIYQHLSREEIILMLASTLKKSDLPEVMEKLEALVG